MHQQEEQEQERGHGADGKQAEGQLVLAKLQPRLTSVARLDVGGVRRGRHARRPARPPPVPAAKLPTMKYASTTWT